MRIRHHEEFGESVSRYEPETAEATIRELDEQYAAGEIDRRAYFEKKQSLVRLYLKATTRPQRRRRSEPPENYAGD